jgi:hypothetical protein
MAWTTNQASEYAFKNPDVMKAFQDGWLNNGDKDLTSAMQAHYDLFGQKEGRLVPNANDGFPTGYNPLADPFNNPSSYKQYPGAPVNSAPQPGWGLAGIGMASNSNGVTNTAPVTNNYNQNLSNLTNTTSNNSQTLGLPALYPRRRAEQSFNRGNKYFNMGSGNYQNRFA